MDGRGQLDLLQAHLIGAGDAPFAPKLRQSPIRTPTAIRRPGVLRKPDWSEQSNTIALNLEPLSNRNPLISNARLLTTIPNLNVANFFGYNLPMATFRH